MPQQTLADMIRPAAKRWAEKASLVELATHLPANLFFRDAVGQVAAPAKPPAVPGAPQPLAATQPKRRRRKKGLSQKAKKIIQEKLTGIKVGTSKYQKVRDQIVKELGVRPRQIGAYAAQMKPAGSRRKKLRKKKR